MEKLDRILHREDVISRVGVYQIDHRGESRRLAASGRSRNQHDAARLHGELFADGRQAELLHGRDLGRYQPQHERDRAPLTEDIDPEAGYTGDRVGCVHVARVGELVPLILIEEGLGDRVGMFRLERHLSDRFYDARDAYARRLADLQVGVAPAVLDHFLQ